MGLSKVSEAPYLPCELGNTASLIHSFLNLLKFIKYMSNFTPFLISTQSCEVASWYSDLILCFIQFTCQIKGWYTSTVHMSAFHFNYSFTETDVFLCRQLPQTSKSYHPQEGQCSFMTIFFHMHYFIRLPCIFWSSFFMHHLHILLVDCTHQLYTEDI